MSEKLDGIRCQWTGRYLYTRDGRRLATPSFFTAKFPRSPLDGELYLGRGQYQQLLSLIFNPKRKEEDWLPLTFVVFDAPSLNMPFFSRLEVKIFHSPKLIVSHSKSILILFQSMKQVLSLRDSQFLALHQFKHINSKTNPEEIAQQELKNIENLGSYQTQARW